MRLVYLPVALLLCHALVASAYEDSNLEDDDFAEFEQFDAEDDIADIADFKEDDVEEMQAPPKQKQEEPEFEKMTEDDILVEDEDNEFEHFQDPEEFEGYADVPLPTQEQPKITISKVPITARLRWDAYWLEGILCVLLTMYAASYAAGRSKNSTIAYNFLKRHKPLLDENFTLVGETGADIVVPGSERGWRREAEHCYTMWCSGRLCCEGMLLTLKLIKRQDLVNVILGMFRPTPDTLQFRVELGKDDSDPFVLCVGQKKIVTKLVKEMQDLSVFCPEKRPGDKHGLPSTLCVASESAEAASGLLDARATAALHAHHASLQYIHVSDAYCGPKQMESETSTTPPETEKVLLASFNLGPEGGGDEVRQLIQLVLYLLDKLRRLRLSKEALAKCEKRRQKVLELWQRGTHAARQEQAAARREERRKQEKEKILAEDDPDKQRRWELKEQKRQMKKKTPKMKQLKVKAL